MEFMRNKPDKCYPLCIVDPPYGMPKDSTHGRGKLKGRVLNNGGVEKWDVKPNQDYFSELFRVSENQIIWGGNYFGLQEVEVSLFGIKNNRLRILVRQNLHGLAFRPFQKYLDWRQQGQMMK